MSYKPQSLACLVETGFVVLALLPTGLEYAPYHATLSTWSLPQYSCCPPARQAYSQSASLGKRYCLPVLALSFWMNSWTSFQFTFSTGQVSPHPLLKKPPLNLLGLLPIIAFHCP